MPKMKTNKGVRKRFSITCRGKVKRKQANKRHLLVGRSSSRKRHLRKTVLVRDGETESIRRLLPYD